MKNKPKGYNYILLYLIFISAALISCKNTSNENPEKQLQTAFSENSREKDLFFDISLAQWSLHKPIYAGELSPMDFAEEANKLGFKGIEYVSGFYKPFYENAENPKAAFQKMLDTLKVRSEKFAVKNVLIMVDGEGPLAASDDKIRHQAIENHKKWVNAAEYLGAHSIRVNLQGSEEPKEWKKNSVDGLTQLGEYAAKKNIGVIVENHGGFSSNAEMLVDVINRVNLSNVGTLPDFGNFCITGGVHDCKKTYPRYKGVELLMPFAKAVSAKSYNFNDEGEETKIDYVRMLQIVKDAGYSGFIGIEYEGNELPPTEGILATKALLIEAGSNL
ncbi:MAG TPA: sugar phosphate isomerase/epimerase family protein [Salinimicrobium sp.]|nr:sugar phosphate isomerase/epimerase family protein [Salinimicrobium sp.]